MRHYKYLICLMVCLVSLGINAQVNYFRNANIIVLNDNGDTLDNPWAGGLNYAQFSEIDLNLDGIMDLFVFDKQDNRIVPFINNGIPNQSSYTHAPEYAQDFPALRSWALLRDYNCDGKMDIFSYSSGGMAVWKNTSTTSLTFTLQTSLLYSNFQPNYINLYVSSSDIPAIDDIDGDGDLDILTFSIGGSYVEYHRNLSMETYGTCDSLNFELRNNCWGFFKENFSTNSVTMFDTCAFNVINPEKNSGGNKHSGSTLFTLDIDSNNTKDLVLGDVSFNNLLLLYNDDPSMDFTSSTVINQDSVFPANHLATTAADVYVFPAGYYLDVDNDNVKDLIVANNCYQGCENSENVWIYKNNNANNKPDFDLLNNSFLQDGMIELGEGSYPVFFDHNADGLQDIVVGNYGLYDQSFAPLNYKSSLWLYENIGTASVPAYQLVDSDYVNISTINLDIFGNQPALRLTPTFGDLDNDGDMDMIVGDYFGYLHYFENNAGAGNTASFGLVSPQYFSIDVGNYASPQLIDLDRDNLIDLVIGRRDGYVSYYRNIGTVSAPLFDWVTDSLGYVKTRRWTEFNGNSTPFIYDDAGNYKMLSGSINGALYYYDNIDGNLGGTFNFVDSMYLDIWEGSRSYVNVADVTNDGKLDMVIGDFSGGVAFYEGTNAVGIASNDKKLASINIYPNPAKNNITIDLGINDINGSTIVITDMLGKIITHQIPTQQKVIINLKGYAKGVYLVKFSNQISSSVYKIIKK